MYKIAGQVENRKHHEDLKVGSHRVLNYFIHLLGRQHILEYTAENDLWHVTEGRKVQPINVGVGLPIGDDDGHGVKENTHHQVSSFPMAMNSGFPAAQPMDKNFLKRAVHFLQCLPRPGPLTPPFPRLGKNTHSGGRQHQGHRAGIDDTKTSGRQLSMDYQGM